MKALRFCPILCAAVLSSAAAGQGLIVPQIDTAERPVRASLLQGGDAAETLPRVSPADAAAADAMSKWQTVAAKFIADDSDYGLFLTAGTMLNVGRLLAFRQRDGERTLAWSCSGTLIANRSFLTAAHCFCRSGQQYLSAKACLADSNFRQTEYKVFLPGRGVFDVTSQPHIHPDYRAASEGVDPGKTIIADIGVVTFAQSIPFHPAAVQKVDPDSRRYLLVSFGKLAFSKVIEGRGFKGRTPYQDGVKQASGQPLPEEDLGSCPESAADTICLWYNRLEAASGKKQDSSLCSADSGAPLLRLGADGAIGLVGMASYFAPGGVEICDSTEDRRSYFVVLDRYRDWLKPFQDSTAISAADAKCTEGMFRAPTRFSLTAKSSVLSITAFDEDRFGRPRPRVTVRGPGAGTCISVEEAGIASCDIEGAVEISVDDGFAQLALCQSVKGNQP